MLTKLINWATGFSWKIKLAAFLLSLSVAFYGGWDAHKIIIAAESNRTTQHQLEKAKAAPGKLIKFNQEMRKTNADKDACANAPIPPAVLDLLRK